LGGLLAIDWSFPPLKAPLERFLLPPLATAATRRAEPPEAPTREDKVRQTAAQKETDSSEKIIEEKRLCASRQIEFHSSGKQT